MTPEPASICSGCRQNLHLPIPLRRSFSVPFRLFGVKPSRMNPNTCTICEMAFSRMMKARAVSIDATVMFADLRGYTALTQRIDPAALTLLLDAFYDDCATAIWRYDGLLNKTIGDAVLAIFNFPVRQEDHALEAVLAAREIQQRFSDRREEPMRSIGQIQEEVEIGVGIDSGMTNFGEFGHAHRGQAVAKTGEILVTSAVRDRTGGVISGDGNDHILKSFREPITLFLA